MYGKKISCILIFRFFYLWGNFKKICECSHSKLILFITLFFLFFFYHFILLFHYFIIFFVVSLILLFLFYFLYFCGGDEFIFLEANIRLKFTENIISLRNKLSSFSFFYINFEIIFFFFFFLLK